MSIFKSILAPHIPAFITHPWPIGWSLIIWYFLSDSIHWFTAVSSLKDIEITAKNGIEVECFLERVNPRDVLILNKNAKEKIEKTKVTIHSLPEGKTKNELNFKYFSLLGYYYYKIDSIKLSKINYLEASKFCGRDSINKKLTEIFEGITDVYLKDENTLQKFSYFPIILRAFTLCIYIYNYRKTRRRNEQHVVYAM